MIEITKFDPTTLALLALFNPVVIAVAFAMGRSADQWQKLPVAAFAASVAGFLLYYAAVYLGFIKVSALGGEAAMVALQFLIGLAWATLGYKLSGGARSG